MKGRVLLSKRALLMANTYFIRSDRRRLLVHDEVFSRMAVTFGRNIHAPEIGRGHSALLGSSTVKKFNLKVRYMGGSVLIWGMLDFCQNCKIW